MSGVAAGGGLEGCLQHAAFAGAAGFVGGLTLGGTLHFTALAGIGGSEGSALIAAVASNAAEGYVDAFLISHFVSNNPLEVSHYEASRTALVGGVTGLGASLIGKGLGLGVTEELARLGASPRSAAVAATYLADVGEAAARDATMQTAEIVWGRQEEYSIWRTLVVAGSAVAVRRRQIRKGGLQVPTDIAELASDTGGRTRLASQPGPDGRARIGFATEWGPSLKSARDVDFSVFRAAAHHASGHIDALPGVGRLHQLARRSRSGQRFRSPGQAAADEFLKIPRRGNYVGRGGTSSAGAPRLAVTQPPGRVFEVGLSPTRSPAPHSSRQLATLPHGTRRRLVGRGLGGTRSPKTDRWELYEWVR